MWPFVLALAVLILVGIALLPGTGVRSRMVLLLKLAVQASLVAAVAAAATFSIRSDWAPQWLTDWLSPAFAWLAQFDPNGFVSRYPYLALGLVIALAGLPLLVVLDTLRHQAAVVALLHRISRQLRQSRRLREPSPASESLRDKIQSLLNELRDGHENAS